jgi:ankyrin repeat protein
MKIPKTDRDLWLIAAERGDVHHLGRLFRVYGKSILETQTPLLRLTALMLACGAGNMKMVKFLIKSGVNVKAKHNKALMVAVSIGRLDIVKLLVKHGAKVNAINDMPMVLAVQNSHLDIVKFLMNLGAKITTREDYPLFLAVFNGELRMVKFLIKNGARGDSKNYRAIKWAASRRRPDIMDVLIESGDLETIKFLISERIENNPNDPLLVWCSGKGYLDIIENIKARGVHET